MKKDDIIFWCATGIIALMEGVMPLGTLLFAPQYVTYGTKPLGYPDYFAFALVIAKVLGVIAIVYPKTPKVLKEWAYAGFTFNLIFAAISHTMVDKEVANVVMPLVILMVLLTSYKFQKNKTTN